MSLIQTDEFPVRRAGESRLLIGAVRQSDEKAGHLRQRRSARLCGHADRDWPLHHVRKRLHGVRLLVASRGVPETARSELIRVNVGHGVVEREMNHSSRNTSTHVPPCAWPHAHTPDISGIQRSETAR